MEDNRSWTDDVVRGVASRTPTLVELVDPQSRWLAVAAILKQSRSTWLIVPDREVDGTLRELSAHLPEVEVSSVVEPPTEGAALVAESWFFEQVSMRWLTRVYEALPNAMVVLRGDGFVERAREALTRRVRDRRVIAEVRRKVRVGRLVRCTAVLPADLVRDLQGRGGLPIVNDDPNWVAYLEQEIAGTALKSRPIDVGLLLRHTFGERSVVVMGEALSVAGSMAFAANVLFFDRKPASKHPWTKQMWVYDLRTNKHFTLKTKRMKRSDLDEFVECFAADDRSKRVPTWSEETPDGRWRVYDYEELVARDKCSLDLFWLKDDSLLDAENLPDPDVIAEEIAEDLRSALEQIEEILGDLVGPSASAGTR